MLLLQVQYFARDDPFGKNVRSSADRTVSPTASATADRINMAALDSSCGWIATAADLARLFESLAGNAPTSGGGGGGTSSSQTTGGSAFPILRRDTVRMMLARPTYGNEPAVPVPSSSSSSSQQQQSAVQQSRAWYGLGLVVEDAGHTFWHSGTLEDSTSVVAHDALSGYTWSALLNCRLEPTNDLGDFMRYAVRQVFFGGSSLYSSMISSFAPGSSVAAVAAASSSNSSSVSSSASSSWSSDQQQDSGSVDHLHVGHLAGPKAVLNNDVVNGDDDVDAAALTTSLRAAVLRLVDALSTDSRTAVKLMVPDYRVEELVNGVSAFGYRPSWLDAYDYRGQIYFNVIWTRNDESVR